MTTSERLRAFRAQQGGISQAKAAEMTGMSKRTWEGWENEAREPPACLLVLLDYIQRFGTLSKPDVGVDSHDH